MTIDDRARAAARALHDEVAASTDTESALARVVAAHAHRPRRRLPLVAAAAAVLAVVALSTAVVASGDDDTDDEVSIDVDPDPDAAVDGTPLRLLAPDDGRQSIGLPVVVQPAADLADGQTVHVEAGGFEPGEYVGVVQCTADAREPVDAGVDACRTSPFTQLTADANGDVAGEIAVSRTLTVPFSGTVDCAAAPGACLVGVGALADYDRSGGMPLTFTATGGALALPTVELSRTTGLGDGEVVHVSGSGFTGDAIALTVCATSPVACWATGDPAVADSVDPTTIEGTYGASLLVADDGTIDGDVALWRFLPGSEPGTYVDCELSACFLRFAGVRSPAPVALDFSGSEDPPTAATIEVLPADGLRAGDRIEVRGTGFRGGPQLLFCAVQPGGGIDGPPGTLTSQPQSSCSALGDLPIEVDADGAFTIEADLEAFDPTPTCLGTDEAGDPSGCVTVGPDWSFEVQAYDGPGVDPLEFPPPGFWPLPVVIGFTP